MPVSSPGAPPRRIEPPPQPPLPNTHARARARAPHAPPRTCSREFRSGHTGQSRQDRRSCVLMTPLMAYARFPMQLPRMQAARLRLLVFVLQLARFPPKKLMPCPANGSLHRALRPLGWMSRTPLVLLVVALLRPCLGTSNHVLQFESSTAQYATTSLKLPAGSFSPIVLFRPGYPPGHGFIVDNGGGDGGCDESSMILVDPANPNGAVSQTGHLATARWSFGSIACQGGTVTNPTSPAPLPVGSWTHLVGVFTQYTGQLYVNGTLVSKASYTGSYGPPRSNDFGFTFGAAWGGTNTS